MKIKIQRIKKNYAPISCEIKLNFDQISIKTDKMYDLKDIEPKRYVTKLIFDFNLNLNLDFNSNKIIEQ